MKNITILLVEDNSGDVELARVALEINKVYNELCVVDDGEAAMAFLRRTGKYAAAPRPDLVLLDLNLPKKDGREVLAEIKDFAVDRSFMDDVCLVGVEVAAHA